MSIDVDTRPKFRVLRFVKSDEGREFVEQVKYHPDGPWPPPEVMYLVELPEYIQGDQKCYLVLSVESLRAVDLTANSWIAHRYKRVKYGDPDANAYPWITQGALYVPEADDG